MTTIHPAQRLLLSAIAVTLSTGAVAYTDAPPTSGSPAGLHKLLLHRSDIGSSEVRPKDNSANLTFKNGLDSYSEVDYGVKG